MTDIKTKFSMEIERIKSNSPDVSYIEVIADHCERHSIDLHSVPRLISISLKQKITRESQERKLISSISEHFTMDGFL